MPLAQKLFRQSIRFRQHIGVRPYRTVDEVEILAIRLVIARNTIRIMTDQTSAAYEPEKRQNDNRNDSFAAGLLAIPRGAGMILRSPRLFVWALIPALLSVFFFVILATVAFIYGDDLLHLLWSEIGEAEVWYKVFLGAFQWFCELLVRLACVFLSAMVAFFFSMIIVEPFIDLLSETTEIKMGHTPPDKPFTLRHAGHEMFFMAKDISLDLGIFAVYQLACFITLLIPVAGGVVCLALQTAGAAFFAGLEMMSGPVARRGVHGRQRWRRLVRHKPLVLGVGAGALVLTLVPLAQLFTLPIAVVGGTIAVLEAGLAESS